MHGASEISDRIFAVPLGVLHKILINLRMIRLLIRDDLYRDMIETVNLGSWA
jgi:hypothetical protein